MKGEIKRIFKNNLSGLLFLILFIVLVVLKIDDLIKYGSIGFGGFDIPDFDILSHVYMVLYLAFSFLLFKRYSKIRINNLLEIYWSSALLIIIGLIFFFSFEITLLYSITLLLVPLILFFVLKHLIQK